MLTPQIIYVLIVTGTALVLFITDRLPADLVALLVLISLGLGGILTLPELFAGFSSTVIITLLGTFMLTAALEHTGVTARVSRALMRRTQDLPAQGLAGVLAGAAAVASMTMNTIAAAALVVPIGRRIGLKRDISPSKLLMPISYGALLGGMATLLTSSNLILASLLADKGLKPFGLLDFLPVGGPIAIAGLFYLGIVSQRLLPERSPSDQFSALRAARQQLTDTYRLMRRLHEAYIASDSPLASMTLAESGLGHQYGVIVSAVVRGRQTYSPPDPDMRLQAGDWLLLQGRPQDTDAAAAAYDLDLQDPDESAQAVLYRTDSEMAEVALSPHTMAAGKTLGDLRLREKYGINVLGIWHRERPMRSHLSEHPLDHGDALLVQGLSSGLRGLSRDPDFFVLTQLPEAPASSSRAYLSLAILLAFLLVIAVGLVPVALAAFVAGIATVLTGCQTMEQARESIQWRVVFLIAGMLPLATAFEQTGTAQFLVGGLEGLVGNIGPRGLMMLFFLVAVGLAQVTGHATTLIVGPLALSAALGLGISPRPLLMAVAVATSAGFLSPVSHPATLLVMGPGGYKFSDFAKLGFPLVILAAIGVYIFAPLAYPF